MSLEQILKDTKPGMQSVVDDLMKKLAAIRTGRASTGILDNIVVDYYGTMTPLSQMATVFCSGTSDAYGSPMGRYTA